MINVGDFVEMKYGQNAFDKPVYIVVGFGERRYNKDILKLKKVCGSLYNKTSILNKNDIFEYPMEKFRTINVKVERV